MLSFAPCRPLAITLLLLVALMINLVETFVTGTEAGKIRATAPVAAPAPCAGALYGNHMLSAAAASPYTDGPDALTGAALGGALALLAQLGASLPLPRLLRPIGLASFIGSSSGSASDASSLTLPAVADFRLAVATLPLTTAAASDSSVASNAAAVASWRQAPLPVPGLVDVEQLPAVTSAEGKDAAADADQLLLASHYGGFGRWGGSGSSAAASLSANGGASAVAAAPAASGAGSPSGATGSGGSASLGRNTLHIWSASAGREIASVSLDSFIDARAQGPIRSITLMPAAAAAAAGDAAGADASCVDPVGASAASGASAAAGARVYRVIVATDAALTTVQLTLTLASASASASPRASLTALPLASFSVPLDIAAPLPSGLRTYAGAAAAGTPAVGDIALSSIGSNAGSSDAAAAAAAGQLDRAHVLFPAEGVVRSFRLPCWEPLAVARLPAPPSGGAAWRGMTAAAGADGRALLLADASGAALHEVTLP